MFGIFFSIFVFVLIPNTKVMKPMISHRKDIVEDKTQELVQVLSKKPDREHVYKNQVDGFLKHACCRLLIFWSVITTLSSVVSIYYAVETQNRLSEITSDSFLAGEFNKSQIEEPRFHDIATRF